MVTPLRFLTETNAKLLREAPTGQMTGHVIQNHMYEKKKKFSINNKVRNPELQVHFKY